MAATQAFFAAHKRRASLGPTTSLAPLVEEHRPSAGGSSHDKLPVPASPEMMTKALSSPETTGTTHSSKWKWTLPGNNPPPAAAAAATTTPDTLGNPVNIVLPKTPNKEPMKFLSFGLSSPAVKPTQEKAQASLLAYYKKNNAYEKWRDLLEQTNDVNAKAMGDTALVTACRRSEKKAVKLLIEAMADVNLSADDGDTALIWAAKKGDETIAKILVEAKADVNMSDMDGNTPLTCAQAEGHEDVINYLKAAIEEAGPSEGKKVKHNRTRTGTAVDFHKIIPHKQHTETSSSSSASAAGSSSSSAASAVTIAHKRDSGSRESGTTVTVTSASAHGGGSSSGTARE